MTLARIRQPASTIMRPTSISSSFSCRLRKKICCEMLLVVRCIKQHWPWHVICGNVYWHMVKWISLGLVNLYLII